MGRQNTVFYAYRMAQIRWLCTRKDHEKKFRVCSIFKEEANLFLIQNAQETEEAMEEVELKFAETSCPLLWLSILRFSERLQFAEASEGFRSLFLYYKINRFAL